MWGNGVLPIEGTTQLIRAVLLNNLPRVLQLVQIGAPLDLADDVGDTALHYASHLGHEHVARALLDGKYDGCGATVNLRSRSNWTALCFASRAGHEAVVRLLLARGAPEESGALFASALSLAVGGGNAGVVSLLLASPDGAAALAERGPFIGTHLMWASHLGREDVMRVLLSRGAQQGLQDRRGYTALHCAVDGDSPGAVALLCSAPGAAAALALRSDADAGYGGLTPLGLAVGDGHAECEAILRAHGATE